MCNSPRYYIRKRPQRGGLKKHGSWGVWGILSICPFQLVKTEWKLRLTEVKLALSTLQFVFRQYVKYHYDTRCINWAMGKITNDRVRREFHGTAINCHRAHELTSCGDNLYYWARALVFSHFLLATPGVGGVSGQPSDNFKRKFGWIRKCP